jgi:hypothetical protein
VARNGFQIFDADTHVGPAAEILVSARDVAHGLAEIAAWAHKRWPLGLFVYAPYGMPLDHPDLEPFT